MALDKLDADLTGWASKEVEAECGYAWLDKEGRKWYHTPPKVMKEGGLFFSLQLAAVSIFSLRFSSFPLYPDELRSVRVKILPSSSNETTPDFLLGKVLQTDEAAQHCVGDSGSPLVSSSPSLLRGGRSVLIGIAVTGDRGCGGGEPIGFARVTGEIAKWIRYIFFRFLKRIFYFILYLQDNGWNPVPMKPKTELGEKLLGFQR